MFWQSLLTKIRRKLFIKKWRKEKTSANELATYISFNSTVNWKKITPAKAMSTQIIVSSANIFEYLQKLTVAIHVVGADEIQPPVQQFPKEISVDNFFCDQRMVPVNIDEMIPKLLAAYVEYGAALNALEPSKQSYYNRVHGRLWHDGAEIADALDKLARG